MGLLLKVIGACVIAETIGSKVQSIAEDAHETERHKATATANANKEIARMQEATKRENARLRAEIAKMHEETERSNALLRAETERSNARLREETERANAILRAEAKVVAERIRASGMVATASIMYGRDGRTNTANTINSSDYVQYGNSAFRNSVPSGLISDITGMRDATDSESRFCNKCGSELIPGSFFCRNCGNRIR